MKVLIACEFSGIVRDAFVAKGHNAWSCDLLPTEKPGNHIQGDVLEILNDSWDLMIAHPPCTYLSYAATAHWNKPGRAEKRKEAMDFFMQLYNAPIPKICVENPRGYPMIAFRSADQIIQPYYFGDREMKTTCLWLKNLPCLAHFEQDGLFGNQKTHTKKPEPSYVKPDGTPRYFTEKQSPSPERWKNRSRFWPSIAKAMAEQWSDDGIIR